MNKRSSSAGAVLAAILSIPAFCTCAFRILELFGCYDGLAVMVSSPKCSDLDLLPGYEFLSLFAFLATMSWIVVAPLVLYVSVRTIHSVGLDKAEGISTPALRTTQLALVYASLFAQVITMLRVFA